MSRSNPSQNLRSPASCRWEWKGGEGDLQWYDKDAQENVEEKLPFTFLLLDRTACVTGYSEPKGSGMYSNEVRDTKTQPLIVKWQRSGMGTVAEGLWDDIKEKVKGNSGKFALNLWVAYKTKEGFGVGVVKVSGCALGPWIEFEKKAGKAIYEKAIMVSRGEQEGKAIKYFPPVFGLKDVKDETNAAAQRLDVELQEYLSVYFARPTKARVEAAAAHAEESQGEPEGAPADAEPEADPAVDEDVPF